MNFAKRFTFWRRESRRPNLEYSNSWQFGKIYKKKSQPKLVDFGWCKLRELTIASVVSTECIWVVTPTFLFPFRNFRRPHLIICIEVCMVFTHLSHFYLRIFWSICYHLTFPPRCTFMIRSYKTMQMYFLLDQRGDA